MNDVSPTSITARPEEAAGPESKRVKTEPVAPELKAEEVAAPDVKAQIAAPEPKTEQASAPDGAVAASKPDGVALSALGLAAGQRVEVSWEVEMTDGSEESVWWGATLSVPDGDAAAAAGGEAAAAKSEAGDPGEPGEAGEALLVYDESHGFSQETRRVLFTSTCALWDSVLGEALRWRAEGGAEGAEGAEEQAAGAGDEEALPVGSAVKARFQGGALWRAGTVAEHNADGTIDVLYEDRTLEQGVPRDLARGVKLSAAAARALAEEDGQPAPAAEGVEAFFEMFVSSLTGGAMFGRLNAEQQAVASEKVRAMRPAFEAELLALQEERGYGATVTGEDVKAILPRVIARQRSDAQQEAAAAAQ